MKKTTLKKPSPPTIDYDALWKDLLMEFFEEAIELMLPSLWAEVDWSVPPVFLQQEFINYLKGRYKIKDKRRFSDILARLVLKTKQLQFLYCHAEVQKDLRANFGLRMFIYQSLLMLKYDEVAFTALAIFIGEAPKAEHKKFERQHFGTTLSYLFNVYVVIEQDEAVLMASDNPIAIAILAAKYTVETEKDEVRRFAYKRKVFELAFAKNIPRDKIMRLLIFVHDCMSLSPAMETRFNDEFPIFKEEKIEAMQITERHIDLFDAFYKKAFGGKSFRVILAEKEAERQAALADKEAENAKVVRKLYSELNFTAQKIADLMEYDLAFVEKVISEI